MALSAIIVGLSNLNNLNVPLTFAGGRAGNLHHGGGYRNLPHELYELSFRRVQRFIHCALPGEFPLTIFYMKAVKYEI